jgi:hypothetical protein
MDSLRDKYSITTLVLDLDSALKNSEYEALMAVTFIVDEALILGPDAWVYSRPRIWTGNRLRFGRSR